MQCDESHPTSRMLDASGNQKVAAHSPQTKIECKSLVICHCTQLPCVSKMFTSPAVQVGTQTQAANAAGNDTD